MKSFCKKIRVFFCSNREVFSLEDKSSFGFFLGEVSHYLRVKPLEGKI